jgi:AcrR family transcriptional regulator
LTYHHGNLRKSLLERATYVIAEQGIESLSLRALARDLGVSHAAPSRHFADKADLLRALATEGNERFIGYIFAAAEAAGEDPLERYAAMGKAYIRFSLEFPAYYKALSHPDVIAHADEELSATRDRRREIIYEAARAAQAAGWLPEETTEHVVIFSIATVHGVADMFADPVHRADYAAGDSVALIETVVRLIIDPKNPQTSMPGKTGAKSKNKGSRT